MSKIDLPLLELLAGLAEECSELSQAALKLRRAYDGTNPTTTSKELAYDHFCEEIADVQLYLNQIAYNKSFVRQIMSEKLKRWEYRLEKKKEEKEPGRREGL